MKPDVNIVEVDPHPSHKGHSVHGVLVGADSLWAITKVQNIILSSWPMLHTHTHTQTNNAKLTHQTSRWKKLIGRRKLLTHAQVDQKRTKGG